MTFGEQVRKAREDKRMTLRSLARALDISAPFLSDVEHDRRSMTEEMTKRMAGLLDVDPMLFEAARGYSRDIAEWLKNNPEIVQLLREARRTNQPLRIGGENCRCCKKE